MSESLYYHQYFVLRRLVIMSTYEGFQDNVRESTKTTSREGIGERDKSNGPDGRIGETLNYRQVSYVKRATQKWYVIHSLAW